MSLGIIQTSINIFNGHIFISYSSRHDPMLSESQLSPLGSHKNRHEFDDTPSKNVFVTMVLKILITSYFRAPFTIQRANLRANVVIILQKYNLNNLINNLRLYLYGHRTINFSDSRIILLSTIAFTRTLDVFHCRCLLYRHPISIYVPKHCCLSQSFFFSPLSSICVFCVFFILFT